MAKFQLKAGAEVDFLTPEEHAKQLVKLQDFFKKLLEGQEGATLRRTGTNFTTDASGGTASLPQGGKSIYRVPVGFDAFLTRISFDYEGSNAASVVSCDVRVVADQNTPSALLAIYNAVPSVYEASKSHAPLLHGGQEAVVCMQGGPATTEIYCSVQLLLIRRRPLPEDILAQES